MPGCAYVTDPADRTLPTCGQPRTEDSRFCEPHRFEVFGPRRKAFVRQRCTAMVQRRNGEARCQHFAASDGFCRAHRASGAANADVEHREFVYNELVRLGGRYARIVGAEDCALHLEFEDGKLEWHDADLVAESDECELNVTEEG